MLPVAVLTVRATEDSGTRSESVALILTTAMSSQFTSLTRA